MQWILYLRKALGELKSIHWQVLDDRLKEALERKEASRAVTKAPLGWSHVQHVEKKDEKGVIQYGTLSLTA